MRTSYAVVDASVLISGFLTPGPAKRLFRLAEEGAFVLCTSQRLVEEVRRSLAKPKLIAAYVYAPADAERFCSRLPIIGRYITELPNIAAACRDPNDDHVLAAAIAAKVDCIVTGDGDLLDMQEHEGIRMLTVRQFLDELDRGGLA